MKLRWTAAIKHPENSIPNGCGMSGKVAWAPSTKGYNPDRKGRNSHHPPMAFISQTRMVANAWLRPGN